MSSLKIIGAGFGRTGTASLQEALQILGYNCYHMKVVLQKRCSNKWLEAAEGQQDIWDDIFDGFQATVDWPACEFYQELLYKSPKAKVLLTVRDPEKWYHSVLNTIYFTKAKCLDSPLFSFATSLNPVLRGFIKMANKIVWDGRFKGKDLRTSEGKQMAIKIFNDHIEEVKRNVKPNQLLVFDVAEGWEPLCKFLEVPIPSQPFPHVNDTKEFQKRLKTMPYFVYAPLVLFFILLIVIAYLVLRFF